MRHLRTTTLAIGFVLCIFSSVGLGEEKPASQPASAVPAQPTNIFDFGLEPIPNAEGEAEAKPDAAPAVGKPAHPKKTKTPPNSPSAAKEPGDGSAPAALSDSEVGEFLKSCHVDAQGVVTADHVVTLALRGTDNQHFVASGDFWLAPEPTPYKAGQVHFYLRQLSTKKRITLTVNGMMVKRMLLAGEVIKKFAYPMKFSGMEPEKWHHFNIDASKNAITVQFDGQQGVAKGPIETGGTNSLVLGPGAKVKNLKVDILAEGGQPVIADETPVPVEEFYEHDEHLWFWHPRHGRYEIWADTPPAGYHVHKTVALPRREEVIKKHEEEHFHPPQTRIHVEQHRLPPKAKHAPARK